MKAKSYELESWTSSAGKDQLEQLQNLEQRSDEEVDAAAAVEEKKAQGKATRLEGKKELHEEDPSRISPSATERKKERNLQWKMTGL